MQVVHNLGSLLRASAQILRAMGPNLYGPHHETFVRRL